MAALPVTTFGVFPEAPAVLAHGARAARDVFVHAPECGHARPAQVACALAGVLVRVLPAMPLLPSRRRCLRETTDIV
ncbi:MAG: hypothetical protein ACK5JM_11015 [Rhodoblastus sp.]